MVYIIVKDRQSSMRTLKGKTVAEFDRNMEKEGWPTEFSSEESRDRMAFTEKKLGRAIRKEEVCVDGRKLEVKAAHGAAKQGKIRKVNKYGE